MIEALARHNREIQENLRHWDRKPVLRTLYHEFYTRIAQHARLGPDSLCVEIGSGIGNIKDVIPGCLRTDIFANPWLDRVENAYALSFPDGAVSTLVLFDVFHHLEFPGTALREWRRVLKPGGRVVIFEPGVSLAGLLVYGLLHPEPLALNAPIRWLAPEGWSPDADHYYAAQGNATRVFLGARQRHLWQDDWTLVHTQRLAAIAYVLSGGYSKPQLYPDAALPLLRGLDRLCSPFPWLFATRLLVVLEKPD